MKPDKSLKDMTVGVEDEESLSGTRVPSPESSPTSSVFVPVLPCLCLTLCFLFMSSSPSISPSPLSPRQLASTNLLSLGFPHPYLLPPVESVRSSLTISSNVVTRVQQELLQLTVPYDTSMRMAMKYVVHAERKTPPALPKMYCARLTSGKVHALTLPCTHRLILWFNPFRGSNLHPLWSH